MFGHQLENNLKGSDSFFHLNGWRFGWNGIPLHYKKKNLLLVTGHVKKDIKHFNSTGFC